MINSHTSVIKRATCYIATAYALICVGFAQAQENEPTPKELSCNEFVSKIRYVSESEELLNLHSMVTNPEFKIGDCRRTFLKIEIESGWPEGYNYSWHVILDKAVPSYEHINTYISEGHEKEFVEYLVRTFELFSQSIDANSENKLIPIEITGNISSLTSEAGIKQSLTPLEIFYGDFYHGEELKYKKATKALIKALETTKLKMRKKLSKTIMKNLIKSAQVSEALGIPSFGDRDKLGSRKYLFKLLKKSSLMRNL